MLILCIWSVLLLYVHPPPASLPPSPEYPQKRRSQRNPVRVAQIRQRPHHVESGVEDEFLERRILVLGHDEVVEVARPQPQRPPLADGRHPRQRVPVLGVSAAAAATAAPAEAGEVEGHLGHLGVLGALAAVHHGHVHRENVGRDVTAGRETLLTYLATRSQATKREKTIGVLTPTRRFRQRPDPALT